MKRPEFLLALGIAGFVLVMVIAVYPRPASTRAEYCAEELVSRKVTNDRLVESRSCKSWVGWPIEVKDVQQ
ncbi:hypothetical protein EIK76_00235 [Rheinheimera mesophila]|uniref:Transmembrane protein n=1 Tax=Rheinheimera mesophila TaxID=1547515 RepID=A0A3P3QPY4_9GAMM|nr:hypothetical protein [Rheinheimera mesophila]KKL00279.1 hypothetical protein SD53_15910 [Rheinheimera mesophila]RRJ22549.1 hypothetical protein EIK76_00235 [Rheinheimera mesophila]